MEKQTFEEKPSAKNALEKKQPFGKKTNACKKTHFKKNLKKKTKTIFSKKVNETKKKLNFLKKRKQTPDKPV